VNARIHNNGNLGLKPIFISVITPDIKNAINSAMKNGIRTRGVLTFIN
jgi:hypothetical protein